MDASQMSYFLCDPKSMPMQVFHGIPMSMSMSMPMTPIFSRPNSSCSPQAPTLYSNGSSMTPVTSPQPMMSKPTVVVNTEFGTSPTTPPLSMSGSAMSSPNGDMLQTPMNPMFSGIEIKDMPPPWVSHVSPPHTPSDFMSSQSSAASSFTTCPSLSPSPTPDVSEFLDPRNLTVLVTSPSSAVIAPMAEDMLNEQFSKADMEGANFEIEPTVEVVEDLSLDLEDEAEFNFARMNGSLDSFRRPRACTGSSVLSLGHHFFDSAEINFDDTSFDFMTNTPEVDHDVHRNKKARTSPGPSSVTMVGGLASPETTDSRSSTSPVADNSSSLEVSSPEEMSTMASPTCSASPTAVAAPSSRRGRKQSLTEDPSKTFVCDLCNRRFRRQEHLKRHYRSLHTQEKPFECTDCGKKFSRSDNLAQHARTHGSGAIVMDLIEDQEQQQHMYNPLLAATGQEFSPYGKVMVQMSTDMLATAGMVQADVMDGGKKKRKRSE
ncbi:hypothetical protein Cpir12675_002076 [Ceratocystis pirilliformis]|uniref:C2H2-type domain-containing protein n=1 Tax=Ceratocystis pirilliformis TaxID=259994 RepID=A0ABR3ZBK5_9PEZI